MKYIISGTDLKQVDKYTIDTIGIPSLVLMERAALAVAEEIINNSMPTDRIASVCGTGNNGADGVAVARILCNKGYDTCVYIIGDLLKGTAEFKIQLDIYEQVGGKIYFLSSDGGANDNTCNVLSDKFDFTEDIIVDAIFGVGLSRNVEGIYYEVINKINESGAKVFAIDVPSGVQADDGRVLGIAIKANETITFGRNKTGLVLYPGAEYAGNCKVKDIGFPMFVFEKYFNYKCIDKGDFTIIPKRSDSSNKGSYGKILVVAGSDTMSGAAIMCCKAALRMGAGMVKLFTTKPTGEVVRATIPEVMVNIYDEKNYKEKLIHDMDWCDVIAVGPGIGIGTLQATIIEEILKIGKPTVIDADGINMLSENVQIKQFLHNNVVITPHIGEMSRFTGLTISDIKNRVLDVAKCYASDYGITVVLKDARTVISDGKDVYINTSGNNGMSTAGSGDVLTGITAALLAKNMKIVTAGAMAVYIHGLAGDEVANKLSKTALVATDIIDEIINITKLF